MTDDTTSRDTAVPDPVGHTGAVLQALPYYASGPGYPPARAFAVIGCRVVALFVLYQATVWLGYLVPALLNAGSGGLSQSGGLQSLTLVSAPFVGTLAVAALLWWKAGWIADRMIRRDVIPVSGDDAQESVPAASVAAAPAAAAVAPDAAVAPGAAPLSAPAGGGEGSHSPILTAALAAAGVLVLAGGMPELFRSLFVAMFDREHDFAAWWRSIEWHGQLWAGVLKCAMGFWLLLGARGIARFVRNLRHADATAREENEGNQMS